MTQSKAKQRNVTITGLSLDTRAVTLVRNMVVDVPECLLITPLHREMAEMTSLIDARVELRKKSRDRTMTSSDLTEYFSLERKCSSLKAVQVLAAVKAYTDWIVSRSQSIIVHTPVKTTYEAIIIMTDTYLRTEGANGVTCPPISSTTLASLTEPVD